MRIHFWVKRSEIESQRRPRQVVRSRAVISIVAIDKMEFSGADVARALNFTPSAVSKLIGCARSAADLMNDVNGVLNRL
jgi:chromosomal replication initiation ATPase DnaA